MSAFDDRGRAHEAKFARDQEVEFRITARRNRLLGEWAAERMGLTPEETDASAKAVVQADFEDAGDGAVIRKLADDLTAASGASSDAEIRAALNDKTADARRQFIESPTLSERIADARIRTSGAGRPRLSRSTR